MSSEDTFKGELTVRVDHDRIPTIERLAETCTNAARGLGEDDRLLTTPGKLTAPGVTLTWNEAVLPICVTVKAGHSGLRGYGKDLAARRYVQYLTRLIV